MSTPTESPFTCRALLLLVLARGPTYGVGLLKEVERLTTGTLRLSHGTLYPGLAALEQEGLVKSYSGGAPARGGRQRRMYELTTLGLETAAAQMELIGRLVGGA